MRRQMNNYWAGALVGAQEDWRRLEIVREGVAKLNDVVEKGVQDAALSYLSGANA